MPLIIGYLDIQGSVEPIRHLQAYLGIRYENYYVNPETWFTKDCHNQGLEFPNLPFLIDGPIKLTDKSAMIRYIIKKAHCYELLGTSDRDIVLLRTLENVLKDTYLSVYQQCVSNPNFQKSSLEKQVKDKLRQKYKDFSEFLGEKLWFLNYLTVFDFQFYHITHIIGVFLKSNGMKDLIEEFPNLKANTERYRGLVGLRDYLASKESKRLLYFPNTLKFKLVDN